MAMGAREKPAKLPWPRRALWIGAAMFVSLLAASAGIYFAGYVDQPPEQRRTITIAGTAGAVSPSSFLLRTRSGVFTVEVDDANSLYPDGVMLRRGDSVVVAGTIESPGRIEAASIVVAALPRPIVASGSDEERSGARER